MPISMPPGKRFAVCLTFDFDAMSLFFGNDGAFTAHTVSRGEFDARVGVERLLGLLAEFDLTCTWFVPGHTAETWPMLVRAVSEAGHELGNHGYCHEIPLNLSRVDEESALLRGSEVLERVTGQRPFGYRAPRWEPSSHTVELLLKHGFRYSANSMATDFHPTAARIGDRASKDQPFSYGHETTLVEIPSYWYLTDLVQLEHVITYDNRIGVSPRETEWIWREEFDFGYELVPGGCITYVFHPMVIARPHRFLMLRRLIEHIRQRDDVWVTTCLQIADGWTPDTPGLWSLDENGDSRFAVTGSDAEGTR